MPTSRDLSQHTEALMAAFEADNYQVDEEKDVGVFTFQGKVGLLAQHREARNHATGERKRVYYVEGNNYQMGYLLGLMAEKEIARMTTTFINKILFAFVKHSKPKRPSGTLTDEAGERATLGLARSNLVAEILNTILKGHLEQMRQDVPAEYIEEMHGLVEGCKAANPETEVTWDDVWLLNVGVDCILSFVYTGGVPRTRWTLADDAESVEPEELTIPIMCNGFAIFGEREPGETYHYFGRDFMFPTAGVFQDTACLVVYNPSPESGTDALPIVSMAAPGIVGSIAAMNPNGVAAGVDMSPSGNCDPDQPGLNSMLLARHCIQHGRTAEEAVAVIVEAPRGVSWNYIIADGGEQDKACIVEAGKTTEAMDFLAYPPAKLVQKGLLPDGEFLEQHSSGTFQKGVVVRWNGYTYPTAYLEFNQGLWENHNKEPLHSRINYPGDFGEKGYINAHYYDKNCPKSYYFAPQRVTRENVVLVTNHFITPEMRLCAMAPWTTTVSADHIDDIQWRYDTLSDKILRALEAGPIDSETAKNLIDFLAPYGDFPDYYADNPKSEDGEPVIAGSVSLFDLKAKTVESHFGYYCDDWVKLELARYVGE